MPDVLTWIIPYLQLSQFLEDNKGTLETTVQSALETVDANLQWLEKYGGDISGWLAAWEPNPSPGPSTDPSPDSSTEPSTDPSNDSSTDPSPSPSTDAASYLSFNPTMSIIVILSGYLITKYWHYIPSE